MFMIRYANTSDTNTSLGNLPIVSAANSAYSLSNPGLLHTFQLIDVPGAYLTVCGMWNVVSYDTSMKAKHVAC